MMGGDDVESGSGKPGATSASGTSTMRSLFSATGSKDTVLTDQEIRSRVSAFLHALGPRQDVLLLPPDYTRFHSQAGKITQLVAEYYNFIDGATATSVNDDTEELSPDKKRHKSVSADVPTRHHQRSSSTPELKIMPALGTHAPMTDEQISAMFGNDLAAKRPTPFMVHDWRNDVETIGYAPSEMVSKATNGMVNEPWPAQLNKYVWGKRLRDAQNNTSKPPSLVLSIGQVVPHEVMGMANFNKNLFVGVGGVEAINLSHFIGAVHGMENMMGRAANPLRSILNHASEQFLQNELDLWYILTVMGTDSETGDVVMKGLYIGNDIECYNQACALSLEVNFTILPRAPQKVVVHLDKDEFHSTWLGNKAIYRTRMAIADGGEIVILAPGVCRFGEDDRVDELIRRYGYVGTPSILKLMEENQELKENLSAVAHLIHGSSEGRFRVTYCPGHLKREEIESVGFAYGDLDEMRKRYDTDSLRDGWNKEETEDGKSTEFYYISNPALGLWAVSSRFNQDTGAAEDTSNQSRDKKSVRVSSTQTAQDGSGGVGGWAKQPPPAGP